MAMTYGDLVQFINDNPEIQSQNVTVYNCADGEFIPADLIDFSDAEDVLDQGHVFISINAEELENV